MKAKQLGSRSSCPTNGANGTPQYYKAVLSITNTQAAAYAALSHTKQHPKNGGGWYKSIAA